MPLLRRQPFHREKPPPDLHPDEEVFICKLTREVFRDYEKFFERIILCNSLVWSCAITGRSGLTYQEAEESEEKALKQLASFPSYLQKPILYLASKTQRSRLADINDDVFVFAKDRFFKGEMVDVIMGATKKVCKIINVIPPGSSTPKSPKVNGNTEESMEVDGETKSPEKKKVGAKPETYKYMVQATDKSTVNTVSFKMISRKKGLFTRDKCKLFLKQSCDNVDGVWKIKPAKVKKFHLDTVDFEDFFTGPPPEFEFSEIKLKKPPAPKKAEQSSKESSPAPAKKQNKPTESPQVKHSQPQLTLEEIKALREQERLVKEKEREEKLQQKIREREELRKKFEEEKEKRKQEKAQEMEKKREERRVQAEMWKEWSRHRDDLECDDLKVLPEPTAVKCRIPVDHFGDAVMVVEFVNCFSSIFDLRASFPKGFSLNTLTEALLETDAGGLMADLLLMMLTAIFSLQEEEEAEEAELSKQGKQQDMPDDRMASDMSLNQLIDAATAMSQLPLLSHGTTLRKLPLDNFTLTEILRLHLLASGAQGNLANAKFRYQQRGGYMPIDDAGLDFKRREPDIVSKLAVENIYDISPDEKLKLLTVLVDQFLTYAATRDLMEDNYDRLRQLKNDLKQLQWAEQKREREESALRYRNRLEDRQKEKDIMEKRRILKIKKREEMVRREEATKNGVPPGQDVLDLAKDIETTEQELSELKATMLSQEQREQMQTEEDDAEADKKAEYMAKERDFFDNIIDLQHGNAIYPIGRDRMYRRYWVFKSIPGIFVEDDEQYVSPEALQPVPQNPQGSMFDLNNPLAVPAKFNPTKSNEPSDPAQNAPVLTQETKDGSDKENDSMNASNIESSAVEDTNSSPNTQSTNNSLVSTSALKENHSEHAETKKVNGDAIVISDDDDSKDSKPPTLEEEHSLPCIETPAIKQMAEIAKHKCKWAFFNSEESLELLINSLNGRGFRERSLKHAILEHKNRIMGTLSKVPADILHISEEENGDSNGADSGSKLMTKEWKRGRRNVTGMMQNDSAHEGLELNLREMILDLEERIHVGTLGYVRVIDRASWRDAIENGGYEPCTDDPLFMKEIKDKNENGEEDGDTSREEENFTMAIAKDMAKALVQIARGIEPKYMQPPLGDDEKTKLAKQKADKKEEQKKKRDEDDSDDDEDEVKQNVQPKKLMERWEDSCLLSTSLAQVFLHLSTLEKSVTWSKSILHTRCRICRRKCDPEKILLCDQCDLGHHMYCLKPALKHVPEGEWFCPDCKPKDVKVRSPRKGRRRTFSEHVASDSEENEGEDSDEEVESGEEEAEDEGTSDEELDSLCAVCSKSGHLVCCDNCPLSYHLACADPPLKKIPKGRWLCQICSGTDFKAGKIKMNLGKGRKKKTSPKNTPNSSRQSSRKGSPRDSPVTVNSGKKRKREESPLVEKGKMKRGAKSTSKLVQEVQMDEPKQYVSSSRGNTKVQQLKMLEEVVLGLMEEEEAWPFLRPVNKKDAPDYYDIVKKPMDFQTIKNKINKFQYTEPAELVQDVRQIFTNCIEYNKRTTQEFKAGANMSKLFEKRMKNLEESAATNGPTGKRARTK